ncbi:MAG: dicarboxylate/amino acid:cation symporter [Clostridium sp.]|uniref:dicarboxylate/amino acid:cation symporter n=1 Tax=Clostridium sp. TaxID=1506 RepID=UPI002FCBEDE9
MNTNIIFAVILSILSFFIVYFVNKKTGKFAYSVLTAMGLGLALGVIFKENVGFLSVVGKGYMSLIKMIVVPLIVTSLIVSIIRLKDIKTLRTIGVKTVSILLITTGIAGVIGLVIANALNLGVGLTIPAGVEFAAKEVPPFSKVFIDMLPANPLASVVDNKIIPIIIFTLFVAVALLIEDRRKPERVKVFKDFIEGAYAVVKRITAIVVSFIPYGVVALMASVASSSGADTIRSLILVIVSVYIAAIIQLLLVYTPLVAVLGRMSPIKFFKGIFPAQVLAFTSQSSFGTLPVTIRSLVERIGVSEKVASFVAPLGSTVGLNGCGGFYPAIVAVMVANMFSIELSLTSYAVIVFTVIVSSIGIAGVPGSAIMSTTVVLSAVGLPIEGIALVLAIDPILDMARTAINVTGASTTALIVDRTTVLEDAIVVESDDKVIAN